MRSLTKRNWYSFLCFFSVTFIVSSCDKDVVAPPDASESYTVEIKFKEFDQNSTPLGKNARTLAQRSFTKWASTTPYRTQNTQQGYLYYWSFNAETLQPDIRVGTGSKIIYNEGQEPNDFASGWSYDTYSAGQALNLRGLEELIVEMPLTRVLEVQTLGFNISSSGTGPKAFDLKYSQNGEEYLDIQPNNQFSNTNTPQSKNTFQFDLATLSLDLDQKLFIKIIPLPGERGNAGDYNPVTGVTKIDNFHLIGVSEVINEATVFKLHYHIFDAVSRNLVIAGEEVFEPGYLPDLSLTLPLGDYYASFVTNISNDELEVPQHTHADGYFIANYFSNHRAQIFGLVDTFSVDSEMEIELMLERYYSQIRFEFTDMEDLSQISRLVITPEHDPYFYAPFSANMTNPVLDQSDIVIVPNFEEESKEVIFHQFMGQLPNSQTVRYHVDVYDSHNDLLRTFRVSSNIKQNTQLIFRGQLLGGNQHDLKFSVKHNEIWEGEREESF